MKPISPAAAFVLFTGMVVLGANFAAGQSMHVGNFGPTGLELRVEEDRTVRVIAVQDGSPAEGRFNEGEVITAINGMPPLGPEGGAEPLFGHREPLAVFITQAESTDGVLSFTVQSGAQSDGDEVDSREVRVQIPVLGGYSDTWPLNDPKTDRIIRANADFIASLAETGKGLTDHNMWNGWAILMLLSTGEEKDLDVVRRVYQARMASFDQTDTGPHSWHNGLQGIAVCEYYLRTGDETVMPLINAVCESARMFEVQGGWTHWARGVNPQYVAGGLLNAAGTQLLTTLLLAKQCGAEVDEQTLLNSLRFFYRFVGHGSNPYGDHRPEDGFGSNNGKTEMIALAMSAAARAENGEVYAMARDKAALSSLYNYPNMLQGHTGGLGALWYGVAAALMIEQKPALYANRMEYTRWFFELSRRHNGAFGASGTGRYDDQTYGYAVGLSLTAPRRTLQITGAPRSPHAKPFTLPDRPWGREADLAFLSIDGGEAYRGSDDPPHIDSEKIAKADEAGLRSFASHPEHVFRERTASAIREQKLTGLVETLLESDDPLARHTACMVINNFEPWTMRLSIGTRSRKSLGPDDFTPRMFQGLMNIITDPSQALWNVDQALLALAAATPEHVKSRLDDLLPWLDHEEWWLRESAGIALTPAMRDAEAMARILPPLVESIATNMHARPRSTMISMIDRAVKDAPEPIRQQVTQAFIEMYQMTPKVPDPEPGVDHSGITSVALHSTLAAILGRGDPQAIVHGATLSAQRMADMRQREVIRQIDMLIDAARDLDEVYRTEVGAILNEHYRSHLIGDDPDRIKQQIASGADGMIVLDRLLQIDQMAGQSGGWWLLGNTPAGRQESWRTSFEPEDGPHSSVHARYREAELPDHLSGWYEPDYMPQAHGWTADQDEVDAPTPGWRRPPDRWFSEHLPQAGEVIFIRKTFELEDLDDALLRVTLYSRQGYDVYLNGRHIVSNRHHQRGFPARRHFVDAKMRQHLKVGTNVIAARSFLHTAGGRDGGLDLFVEALRELPRFD
jgi:hypothetical protein